MTVRGYQHSKYKEGQALFVPLEYLILGSPTAHAVEQRSSWEQLIKGGGLNTRRCWPEKLQSFYPWGFSNPDLILGNLL